MLTGPCLNHRLCFCLFDPRPVKSLGLASSAGSSSGSSSSSSSPLKAQGIQCPHAYSLQFTKSSAGKYKNGWQCDSCGKKFKKGAQRYPCKQCSPTVDYCRDCLRGATAPGCHVLTSSVGSSGGASKSAHATQKQARKTSTSRDDSNGNGIGRLPWIKSERMLLFFCLGVFFLWYILVGTLWSRVCGPRGAVQNVLHIVARPGCVPVQSSMECRAQLYCSTALTKRFGCPRSETAEEDGRQRYTITLWV